MKLIDDITNHMDWIAYESMIEKESSKRQDFYIGEFGFRIEDILHNYPDLRELYYYNATMHLTIDSFVNARDKWSFLETAIHLATTITDLQKQLTKAIEQGYRPC